MGLYNVLRDNGGALGRHDYAGGLLELWHGEVQAAAQATAQAAPAWDNLTIGPNREIQLWKDGEQIVMAQSESAPLAKHPKEYLNNVPVYEAARFHPDNGDLASWLAFRVLREHHWINQTGGGDIPIFITEYLYDDRLAS
jgi:hypothetical protein